MKTRACHQRCLQFSWLVLLLCPITVFAKELMYVPTGESNELVIIDVSTDKIVGHIGELENAHGLAANPHTEYLVAGSMQHLEPGKPNKAQKPAAMSEAEHESHHKGSGANMAGGTSYVSIIHPKHGHVMRRIAVRGLTHHMTISPDGSLAIAVHSGAGGISVIDLKQMKVTTTVQTGMWPNYAVFSHDGKRLYVSNANPGTVSEIDTKNWKVTREFKVGKAPEHMVLGVSGKMLYIANTDDASVSALDINSGKVKHVYAVGADPHGIDVSANGHWLYVSCKGANNLVRIDLADNTTTNVELAPAPYHLMYLAQGNKLYVSSRKKPLIWVINANNLKVERTIALKKGVAHQMVMVTSKK